MVAAVAATCVAGVALALPSGGSAAQSKCASRHSTTILQNSKVRVFKQPTRDGIRGFDVYACHKPSGETMILGNSFIGDYPFLPPAIDLAGPVIGYADEWCDPPEFCGTSVKATDMRHPHDYRGDVNGAPGSPDGRLVKVGSLRTTGHGTLIWIACPERHRKKLTGSREPNCEEPGDRDSVYMNVYRKKDKLLDRGKTIDPTSLRLRGHKASWLHGGHRRHATLP